MEDKTKIDELFNKGLGQFEAEPPENSWQNIEGELTAAKRKRRLAYWRVAGMTGALILAFFSGYFFHQSTNEVLPDQHNIADHPVEKTPTQPETPSTYDKILNPFDRDKQTVDRNEDSGTYAPGRDPNGNAPVEPAAVAVQESVSNTQVQPVVATAEKSGTSADTDVEKTETREVTGLVNYTETEVNTAIEEDATPLAAVSALTPPAVSDSSSMEPETILAQNQAVSDLSTSEDMGEYVYVDLDEADQASKSKNVPVRFSLGLSASPTFAFSDVSSAPSQTGGTIANNYQNSTTPPDDNVLTSYAGGLNLNYRASSRWEIGTGLHINTWKQVSSDVVLTGQPNSGIVATEFTATGNTSTGNVKYDISSTADTTRFANLGPTTFLLVPDIRQEYQFVEIPINAGYYLVDAHKWTVKLQAGLSGRILTNSDVNLVFEDGHEENYDGLEIRKFTLQAAGGVGLGYKVSKELKVNLSPTIQYGLTPVNQNESTTTYFHQFLIYSGLSYSF